MSPRLMRVMIASLLSLDAIYLAAVAWRLVSQETLTDLVQRVNGLLLIRAGRTPYTLDYVSVADAPWAWLGNALLYWPPMLERAYYALLMAGVIVLLAAWAYREGERARKGGGLLLASGTLAMSSLVTASGLGQNSPFMIAALVCCYVLVRRRHRVLAGICLGFALAKPQISLLFAVPLLVTGEFMVLAVAAGYSIVAMLAVCWMTGLTPIALMQDWQRYIAGINWPGYGPYQVLVEAGLPEHIVLVASALVFGAIALTAIAMLRDRPLILLLAIAAAAGRLGSYHQLYDNLMMVFLLVAAGEYALRSNSRQAAVTFVLVGVTVWMPGRVCQLPLFQWFQMIVWASATVMVAVAAKRWLPADDWRVEAQAATA